VTAGGEEGDLVAGRVTWWGERRNVLERRGRTSRGTKRMWVGAPTPDPPGGWMGSGWAPVWR